MSEKLKSIITIPIILLALFQAFAYNSFGSKETQLPQIIEEKQSKSLCELIKGLDCLENKQILSANKVNDAWNIKIKIYGIREQILNEISKLNEFNINSYRITKKNNEIYVVLEISGKN